MPNRFPWNETPDGGHFFTPAVNAARVRDEGLSEAILLGIRAHARVGIYNKQYGVIFQRVNMFGAPRRRSGAAQP